VSAPVTRDDVMRDKEELLLRFSFMDAGLGEAASVTFLRALQRELKAYIPELKSYLESHARQMPGSGRLALESGILSYEALLKWTKRALTSYGKHEKGGRKP
jgi:hypothetical protein